MTEKATDLGKPRGPSIYVVEESFDCDGSYVRLATSDTGAVLEWLESLPDREALERYYVTRWLDGAVAATIDGAEALKRHGRKLPPARECTPPAGPYGDMLRSIYLSRTEKLALTERSPWPLMAIGVRDGSGIEAPMRCMSPRKDDE